MDELVDLETALKAGDYQRGGTLALDLYGPELFGYLAAILDETAAEEVFAQLSEDLWRGLPGFAFRSSVRTWLYVLAKNALHRFRRSPWNHKNRRTGSDQLDAWVAKARSRTAPWQRTDVKDRFRALREALDDDDQSLLVLRVDRALAWRDVARVFAGDDATDDVVERETVRLRKRFQVLKDQLREQAIADGLIDSDAKS